MNEKTLILPSERTQAISYAVRDVVIIARQAEKAGKALIYLNIGDPLQYDFATPSHIIEAAVAALRNQQNGYAASEGIKAALDAIAALGSQESQLGRCFHAFGNHFQLQVVGQRDDRTHNGRIVGIHHDIVDEGAVNLQDINGKTLEINKGRITDAKVIDGKPNLFILEPAKHVDGGQTAFHQYAFRKFQNQVARVKPRLLKDGGDQLLKVF